MKFKIPSLVAGCRFSIANRKSQIRNHSAFTLIEIMVSIMIFALIVAAIYSTWVLILKSSQVGQAAAARAQRQRIAIRTIEDSLTCIQSAQASMQYYSFVVQNGDEPQFSFVSRVPDIFPRNGKFINPDTGQDFPLRRLTFAVEPDANSVKNLVLRQTPILMSMDQDEQTTPLILARDVKDFLVECWDTNKLEWDTEWDDTNSIPPLIRVTLTLNGMADPDSGNSSLAIQREIAMPSETLPSIEQTGGPGVGGPGAIGIGVPGGGISITPGGGGIKIGGKQ
jgi:prepilin-type N-terminal cleavage/methylation domain-containing protein